MSSSKNKIAIIGSRGYPVVYSGYETLVTHLCAHLKDDFEITVYCHGHLFTEKPAKVNGINLIYTEGKQGKTKAQLSNSFAAFNHARKNNFDVIFVVNAANGVFGFFKYFCKSTFIINVDGLEWLRPKWKGLGARFFKLAAWLACKWYHKIVTDADAMKAIYLHEFKRESVVIEYGATIPNSTSQKGLESWGLTREGYYLIVGRLIPDNNSDLILKAFIASKSEKKLVIVGDVPYEDKYANSIKELAKHDNRVLMTGYVIDQEILQALYQNCYYYFHGHEFGGTNPTILKALAYNCPIMAIDTVFSKEVLDSYKYGIPFKKDVKQLATIIDEIAQYDNFRVELKKIGEKRIAERYTWERIASLYRNLFVN
jgi:glycosyltransferase involved in cell wall biosynthesis